MKREGGPVEKQSSIEGRGSEAAREAGRAAGTAGRSAREAAGQLQREEATGKESGWRRQRRAGFGGRV